MKNFFLLLVVFVISCAGPSGPVGPSGPEGPTIPGLYYVKIFQAGVYPSNYSSQIQTCLRTSNSGAYYTNSYFPLNIGRESGIYYNRIIIKFGMDGIPTSKIMVDKAELILKTTSGIQGGGATDVSVHKVTSPWTEFVAGWNWATSNDSWNKSGGDFTANTITTNAADYDLPASSTITIQLDTKVVENWILNPSTNYGLLLKAANESVTNYSEIYSSGALNSSNRPMLKIWYYTTE